MYINKLKFIGIYLILTSILAPTVVAQQKVVPINRRIETVFDVLIETFDMSDYSEDFRASFFNFSSKGYAHNNCNTRERYIVLKAKDDLMTDLLDNVMFYNQVDIDNKMKTFLRLDLELSILRNLDLLEPVAFKEDDPKYQALVRKLVEQMQKDFEKQYKKQGMHFPPLNTAKDYIKADVLQIIKKYEPNFDTLQPDGTRNGSYTNCNSNFSKVYDDWRKTFTKFDKRNTRSVADFNKQLNELVSAVKNFPENSKKHLQKIFKEESAFLDKATKEGDGFFKNLWNVTKAAGSAMTKDLQKVMTAFQGEYKKLSNNTTYQAPQELKSLMVKKLKQDPTEQALINAVQGGLDLTDISVNVGENTQSYLRDLDLEIKIKKLQILTEISSAYALEIQSKTELSLQQCKDLNKQLKAKGGKSLDSKWKKVYDSQCK